MVSPNGMISDLHGSPEYRANLIKVMTKRAVARRAEPRPRSPTERAPPFKKKPGPKSGQ